MADQEHDGSPPSKRRKQAAATDAPETIIDTSNAEYPASRVESVKSKSWERPISPPPSRRLRSRTPEPSTPRVEQQQQHQQRSPLLTRENADNEKQNEGRMKILPAPIQLTRIKDLTPEQNVDTIGLGEILGDPMIKECWNFNFLFNLDFVMQHFDLDVRNLVNVKIIHGFWKRDDEQRITLQEASEGYQNIELVSAYIPDPFGTHHSKMLVLLRHDDMAQIVIHTANMIERDWRNMTQAVWRSPLLPLQLQTTTPPASQSEGQVYLIGTGERFKVDLLRYLDAYGKRLTSLTQQLSKYDFSSIRAAFIGSAPSRQKPARANSVRQTSWGWLGLREILSSMPVSSPKSEETEAGKPNIVIQISSIATLGATPAWLTHFQSVLSRHSTISSVTSTSTTSDSSISPSKRANFFTKRPVHSTPKPNQKPLDPTFHIIFPTASEIRASLDGYASGASIHTKLQSSAQQKQLQYLHPLLYHWNPSITSSTAPSRKAERGPAAPHIKTYIRFSDPTQKRIDWAMVTSANLSKQAWGEVENKNGEIWIQSWETGVVVWPALYSPTFGSSAAQGGEIMEMVPLFGRDMPAEEDMAEMERDEWIAKTVIGFRMPYDLPLESYRKDNVPWCATAAHEEPDWKGQVWMGYQPH